MRHRQPDETHGTDNAGACRRRLRRKPEANKGRAPEGHAEA